MVEPNKSTDLQSLICNMQAVLNMGEFVYVSVTEKSQVSRTHTIFEFQEKEGFSMILPKNVADELGLPYDYVAAWITLNVNSSLQAVGFTAAFATELGAHGVSCNVVAGFYHDHIFVDYESGRMALGILDAMAAKARAGQ